jgi:NitT/TauT family transport system permease protein
MISSLFSKRILTNLSRLLVVLFFLVVWEFAAKNWVDPMFISPPSKVFGNLGNLLARPGFVPALKSLILELVIAFVISVAIGLSLGLLIGLRRTTHTLAMPIVLLLYGTPQITILPIVMLVAGVGFASKVVFGVTHGFFPVLLTVCSSLQGVKPIYHRAALTMGASPWLKFRYILLPFMLPSLISSLKLAMVASMLGVLLAELFASTQGIGFFTHQFTETFDATSLFGLVSLAVVIAVGFNSILSMIELRFLKR